MIQVKKPVRLPDGSILEIRVSMAIEIAYDSPRDLAEELSEKIKATERRIAAALVEVMETDLIALDDIWLDAIDDALGDEHEE